MADAALKILFIGDIFVLLTQYYGKALHTSLFSEYSRNDSNPSNIRSRLERHANMSRNVSLDLTYGQYQHHRNISPDRLHHSDHEDSDDDGHESERLYRRFLHQRMIENRIQVDPRHDRHDGHDRLTVESFDRQGYNHGQENILTQELNTLAASFRRSGGREEVMRRAEMVDMETLTLDNLTLMLTELFVDGVTQERVMVLFYFISDLVIRAVKTGVIRVISSVSSWSLKFIRGTLSTWVRLRGGWRQILTTVNDTMSSSSVTSSSSLSSTVTVNQAALMSACVVILSVSVVWFKRSL